ncbi:hypothetical protein [Streptomyces noursei]
MSAKRKTPVVIRDCALDWIKFDAELARDGSVDPVDKALYAALATFVDKGARTSDDDPDGDDVPTRKVLAACIGRSLDVVDRSTARLEKQGLIQVERRRDPDNPRLHLPSVYRLLDHLRWDARAAERHAKRQMEGGRIFAATPDDGDDDGEAEVIREGGRKNAARGGRKNAATRTDAARGGRTDAAVPSSSSEGRRQNAGAGARQADPSPVAEAVTKDDEEQNQEHKTPSDPPGAASQDTADPDPDPDHDTADEESSEARTFVAALPGMDRKGPRDHVALYPLVDAALAAGWTEKALAAHLVREVTPSRCRNVAAVYGTQLDNLPVPPAPAATPAARAGFCPTHPHIWIGDGSACASCTPRPTRTNASAAAQAVMAAARAHLAQQDVERATELEHARL